MTLVKFNDQKKANGYSTFNELFDSFFNDSFVAHKPAYQVPAVNVSETENAFILDLAAPGLKKEDFKIALEKDVLTISADVKNETNEEGAKFNKREFSYHAFSRSFNLPDLVDHGNIEASYENGVLQISIPKKEEAKVLSRQIEIK
ncbi:MAG TPA: Hsp20/alpha crystallin family protein [Pelobium sp.]|jgi:HSP20 family protein|nr:Hsp20/alpha crystallin family protein [Pelobium sp.]